MRSVLIFLLLILTIPSVVANTLIMYSSMDSSTSLWQPEVNQGTYATQSEAIRVPGQVSYVPGLFGSATSIGSLGQWDGVIWIPGQNIDIADVGQDGGRFDVWIRFDQPLSSIGNKFLIWSPYTDIGGREFQLEVTGTDVGMMFDVYGDPWPPFKSRYDKFRVNPNGHPLWEAIQPGEWHQFTILWRNNGRDHTDELWYFIDGELAGNDFSGNLPADGLVQHIALGWAPLITFDEFYSFSSWDTGGAIGNFANLNWVEGVTLKYPLNNGGPEWGKPVTDTNMPEYQWQIQNDLSSTTSCDLFVDGSFVQTVNNIVNLEHVEVIPNLPLSNGNHNWQVTCDAGRLVSPTYTFLVDFIAPTEPTLISVTGSMDDGALVTLNGFLLGSHTNQVEWLGGINGALESMPSGTRLEHYALTPDPNWNAVGWVAGESVNDYSTPRITTENVHSGAHSLRHEAFGEHGPASWVSTSAYQPVRDTADPNMPDVFDETFASAWIYFNPLGNDGNDTSQWKIMNVQHRMGGNIAEGNFWLETTWDDTLNVWDGIPHFYAVDENRGECTYPCSTSSLSCKNCAYPGPPQSSSEASSYYWASRDSYGSTTPPPYEAFEWMRIDWWVEASSDFDTWDGNMNYRLFIPSLGTSYQYRLNGIATHGSDPLLDSGETLYPPYWDLVFDTVQWKNQISHGYGEAIIYIDDQYVQFGTPARIEICNNVDYSAATHCEIQRPTNWADSNIQFETNFGSFSSGEQVYLFVITDDLSVTNGLPVTLGSGGTSATCFDGVQNQGETGVDCGGPCAACVVEETCTDGIRNQDEVHTDCGGSICAACECYVPSSVSCITSAGCAGEQICVDGNYATCTDADPNDDCPVIGQVVVLQNNDTTYFGQEDACIEFYTWDSNRENTTYDYCNMRGSSIKFLMKFDLSGLPAGRDILSANLELTEYGGGSQANSNVTISQLLKPWSASGVTWLCTNDENHNRCADVSDIPWQISGVNGVLDKGSVIEKKYFGNLQKVTFDVTQMVTEWYNTPSSNNGFVLEQVDTAAYVEIAHEDYYPITDRPKLIIEFAPLGCSYVGFDITGECGFVGWDDFLIVVENFRTSNSRYDFNGDGVVNVLDLVLHLLNWG